MKKAIFYIFLCCGVYSCSPPNNRADLAGEWAFALDPADEGVKSQWFSKPLQNKILLPGSLQEQGYGNAIDLNTPWTGNIVDSSYFKLPEYEPYRQEGNIKIPFWLQPDKYYVGVAWYQKVIDIPKAWKDRYVELSLERTHWETTVYVNGEEVGKSDAMAVPARFAIKATGKILLSVRVDNRVHIPVGPNSHSVSDHTQSNWNGITGKIELVSRPSYHIDAVRIYPDVKNKKARVEIDLEGEPPTDKASLTLKVNGVKTATAAEIADSRAVATLDMGADMLLWSEHTPNLYKLEVTLASQQGVDTKTYTFGMREFKAEGTQFGVNGVPTFLRGTLECCIFPLHGYPAMDEAYWTKIYRRCKEFGLNHVRFHSWCPPEAAFEAADREGIYLQVECGSWANQGSSLGDGRPIDKWLYDESERIVREYGNHPSFCMLVYGNEPAGRNMNDYLTKFVEYWKNRDTRRVYTSGAGWPYLPFVTDYRSEYRKVRIQEWGAGLRSIINGQPPRTDYDWRSGIEGMTMPLVSHEIGQWCVYPDFKEITQYTGVLKAKNFEIFQASLQKHHLGDMADKFLYASGRLQTLCYKADIEAALRTPGFGGFQLLDLHDFPGQGTALVGVLNPFWETKGYVDGAEYSRFCNSVVPLLRLNKLLYSNKDTLDGLVEVANYSGAPLKDVTVRLLNGETCISEMLRQTIPVGNCLELFKLTPPIAPSLTEIAKPTKMSLTVEIADSAKGKTYANSWNIWVYPEEEEEEEESPTATVFTTDLQEAVKKCSEGASVLYCVPKAALNPASTAAKIAIGFSSIFWNTAWTHGQAPHTLGIYCNPQSPALADFPNDGYSDYQWWELVSGSAPLLLDGFPPALKPVVYHIDDWFTNRRLALLFEAKTGVGKILVCGANLSDDMDKRLAAKQFRRSLERYMASSQFNPSVTIDEKLLEQLINQ